MSHSTQFIPGTEVVSRGLRWSIVASESMGQQILYRLRGLECDVIGHEIDILHPFEKVEPVQHDLILDNAAPLSNWLVYPKHFF